MIEKTRRRLPAAGFADKPNALTLGDAERDAVYCLHVCRAEMKLRVKVLDLENAAAAARRTMLWTHHATDD
jgi:hypothetical protein